ncbi:protein sym-1 [Rhododendron vialii]|uniref:protein sym-1 n=1 Tax=Rhododendron vialii TaxID=182163 RepID=UPI00265F15B5|nr:protein sym-1 [Rhododendron vialii]XP_058205299.1 protein sym-1 [Rhododendron vialii]
MALLPNPVTISRKSPLLFRFMSHSLKPTSRISNQTKIPPHPLQISGFRSCSSSLCSQPVSYTRWALFKDMGCKGTGYGLLGSDYFRVSAVSDGGSGGFGGSGGGNSGGKGGSGKGDGGGSKWSLLSWYLSLLDKHPVLTKAVTGALLTLIGDLICQIMIDQVPSLDLKRTFLFTLLGLVLVGPTLHFWYLYLSRLVPLSGASGAFSRLVLDQFLFAPIFIGVFLASLLTLEGRPSDVVPKLQQEWFSAVLANWKLWIPFQFLNFRFVPQQFQVLAANVVAVVWNVILSYKAHKEVLRK